MELRHYASIIVRRLWIIILLLGIILIGYLIWQPVRPTTYQAHMRFVVGVVPEPQGDYYAFDRYYTWLTAEYLVDDLAEVVKSRAFASQVADHSGLAVPPGAIHGATAAGKTHRVLNVNITWGNEAELGSLANATVVVLTEEAGVFFAQLATEDAVVSLIDPPQIGLVGRSLRDRLDLPLRLLLGLAAGIGLAFVLDYLDLTIRDRDELAALGLPIMAEIPAARWWERFLPIRRSLP